MEPNPAAPSARLRAAEAILLAAAFAVAHTQSPLYYSNQNQYFLHGAAMAHYGHLDRDWLANTRDPTPLFSALVAAAYATAVPWALQPAYFALLMGYYLAARWLVAAVPGFPDTRAARLGFAALFTAAHAAILRWLSVQLTGVDYPWYLQAGLAAQYLLGPGLQPSAFGVLLLAAVAAFAHGRSVLACALAAGSCWFHSTYLLPAGLLVFGFICGLTRAHHGRTGYLAGGVAAVVVLPVVAYAFWLFDPFAPIANHAQHILVTLRIPHHCLVSRWFDLVAGLQLVWMALGLLIVQRTAFGQALTVAAIGGLLFTAIQVVTGSESLALMFPWRISALIVPVSTAVIIAAVVGRVVTSRAGARAGSVPSGAGPEGEELPSGPAPEGAHENRLGEAGEGSVFCGDDQHPSPGGEAPPPSPARGEGEELPSPLAGEGAEQACIRRRGEAGEGLSTAICKLQFPAHEAVRGKPAVRWVEWLSLALLLALVAGGVVVTACGLGYRMADEEELYSYIRATAKPEDCYLIPPGFPNVRSGRGAVSNTFKPPPRAEHDTNQIPVDLQRFRLETGSPIYVDFKSVPYAPMDVEVWSRRMKITADLTANHSWERRGQELWLKREGITHVVWPRSTPLAVSYLEVEHAAAGYIVYRLK